MNNIQCVLKSKINGILKKKKKTGKKREREVIEIQFSLPCALVSKEFQLGTNQNYFQKLATDGVTKQSGRDSQNYRIFPNISRFEYKSNV